MEAPRQPLDSKIQRRFLPFAVVGLLAPLTAALPPQPTSWWFVWTGAVLSVLIAAAGVFVPWSRVARSTYILPPLAYFVVIALLREADHGSASSYTVLALLPIVWIALNLGRKEVAGGIAAGIAVIVLPLLVGDPASYGAGEWRRAIVWAAVAALVGFSVESLVREKRRQAREAREQAAAIAAHEQTMAVIAEVVRGLTTSTDTRSHICRATLDVAGASMAAIAEPDGTGHLVVTAHAGAHPGRTRFPIGDGASESPNAFTAGRRFFVADASESRALPRDVVQATGIVSALFEPILRDGLAVGVLAVGWPHKVDDLGERATQAVMLLAAEGATAIERADLLERLEELAQTDELTGLPNRRAWDAAVRGAVADASQSGGRLCVGVVDLDHFKQYNDRHGHQVGDRLLKEAAAAWRDALRKGDTLARYGGEEFAVALPGCSLGVAESVLERLRSLTPVGLTCSVGLAVWDGAESDEELVARADAALYEAKRGGRDALVVAG